MEKDKLNDELEEETNNSENETSDTYEEKKDEQTNNDNNAENSSEDNNASNVDDKVNDEEVNNDYNAENSSEESEYLDDDEKTEVDDEDQFEESAEESGSSDDEETTEVEDGIEDQVKESEEERESSDEEETIEVEDDIEDQAEESEEERESSDEEETTEVEDGIEDQVKESEEKRESSDEEETTEVEDDIEEQNEDFEEERESLDEEETTEVEDENIEDSDSDEVEAKDDEDKVYDVDDSSDDNDMFKNDDDNKDDEEDSNEENEIKDLEEKHALAHSLDDNEDKEKIEDEDNDLDEKKSSKLPLIVFILIVIVVVVFLLLKGCNKEEKYTVKFDTNGGNNISEQVVESDSKVDMPKEPTKEGYTFKGWYIGDEKYDFDTKVKSNMTIEARWEKIEEEDVKVTGVSLDQTEVTLKVDTTIQLTAVVDPENAKDKSVTWSSSDKKVATVDANGKITAKKKGKATIKVVTKDGNHEATCKVTVSTDVVKATGISLDKTSATVGINNTITLRATVKPNNASNKGVKWSSSDNSIAKVENGRVKGLKEGKVTITAETKDGGHKATATITVKAIKVTGVSLSKTSKTIAVGETYTLKATVKPSDATNKGVKWSSSDTSVATVDGGKVKGIKEGKATITVTTKDGGHTATATITVKAPYVEKVTISGSSKVTVNSTITLKATVTTYGNADKTVKWESSNEDIATVTSKGVVKGRKAGTVTITATAGGKSAKKTITVEAEKLNLSITIKAECAQGNGTIQGYSFTVKKDGKEYNDYRAINIAGYNVRKGGKILPTVKAGRYTIIVTTINNGKQTITGTVPSSC